ncbi:MAG: hypothetical protein ACR2M0_14690 [Chloroflexia bacterium]
MATNRQAAASRMDAPNVSPLEDPSRRWRDLTGRLDDGPIAGEVIYRPARTHAAARLAGSSTVRLKLVMLVGASVASVLALYLALSALFGFAQTKLDDMQYGRPRTTHLDAYVGHAGEQAGQPTHFIAMNLDRRIVLVELPGGDTKNATTITGPYLFGDNEDLTPAKLSAEDVNGDGQPDLILMIKNEELVYINDKTHNSFHLMTPDERAKLPSTASGGGPQPTKGAGK